MNLTPSSVITPESKLPKGAWLVVILLFFIAALNFLDRTTITTMRSSIIEATPMSDTQFGLLTSAFLWTYGLLSPFAGFLADRFKRSRVIIVSLFVWSAITWLTAYSTTFEQLLVSRILMGISEACYIPAALALIADYHQGSTRSFATGIHWTGIQFGSSMGFLGGWIAEKHDWHVAFVVFGIIGIVYSLVVMLFLKDVPNSKIIEVSRKDENRVNFFEGIKDLFSRRSFILMVIYASLFGVLGWLITGWLPTYYKEHFSLSQGIAGLYATGYLYPASIIGLLFGGFWADRWSRTNPRGRIFVPVIGLCIATPAVFFASNTSILPLAVLWFMIYAFTVVFTQSNLMPLFCMVADPRYRATGYGLLNLFGTVTAGFGLFAGGVLRDMKVDLSRMFQFAALILLICAVLLFMVKSRTKVNDK
jgi:MFS family permease